MMIKVLDIFIVVLALIELVVFSLAFYKLLLEDKLNIPVLLFLGLLILLILYGFYKSIIEYERSKGYFKKRRMD